MKYPVVIGLDLSLTSAGIAVASGDGTLLVDTIKSSGKRGATWLERSLRLGIMRNGILDVVEMYDPDLIVVETPSYGSNLPGKHDVSGLWWLVVNKLTAVYSMAFVVPKARAKYGTGNGNSPKDVVEAFVREVYTDLLPEHERFKNNDECDATLLAAMGMRHLGYRIEPHELHEDNLKAMENAAWPSTL
jgi:crossover junction endodeoxyribonuclease RuvC